MIRRTILAMAIFCANPANALNWQDDDFDWMGGHAWRYLDGDSTEDHEMMIVDTRDSDEYGLYHLQFACVLGPDSGTIHTSLVLPWRNPYTMSPERHDMTMRFEFADGTAQEQIVAMVQDPMGDDHVSWDGTFALTQSFVTNFARAQTVTLLDGDGNSAHSFESRGSTLAAATLAEFCTGNPSE